MPRKKISDPKIFVIDTSVILYDHQSILNFEDNDIALPITVLEELDNFKKGSDTKNFEARQFIRMMDDLSAGSTLRDWIKLPGRKKGQLKVVMNGQAVPMGQDATKIFGNSQPDHLILNAALRLREDYPARKIILVTKDINLRLKAKSVNLPAEDYLTGKVTNVDDLFKGHSEINDVNSNLLDQLYAEGFVPRDKIFKAAPIANQYFLLKSERNTCLTTFNPETDLIERVDKRPAYGVLPRNAEQTFALHAILNPNVRLVTLQGVAGTGKTLLALAGAIEQRRSFKQILLARPIVPLSNRDIGFLPGDVNSKLNPYMEPLFDNLKMIQNQFNETDKEFKKITEMREQDKLSITPLAYIRGRSLSNICFIVDEAQNLTPHEVKTIITRAGENTKIIFTGDVFQIDTPYLDTQSNGLSYLIDRLHKHALHAHVTLAKGERSELANLANDLL